MAVNIYAFLADAISAVHLVYVSFVVFGQLVIMIGWPLGWRWIRNPWFRMLHLAMILVVAVEAVVDYECPLTTWEFELRRLAEPELLEHVQPADLQDRSFVGRLVGSLMFFDEKWGDVLTYSYYVVAGIVLATLFLVPPRFRKSHSCIVSTSSSPAVPRQPQPSEVYSGPEA